MELFTDTLQMRATRESNGGGTGVAEPARSRSSSRMPRDNLVRLAFRSQSHDRQTGRIASLRRAPRSPLFVGLEPVMTGTGDDTRVRTRPVLGFTRPDPSFVSECA